MTNENSAFNSPRPRMLATVAKRQPVRRELFPNSGFSPPPANMTQTPSSGRRVQTSSSGRFTKRAPSSAHPPVVKNLVPRKRCPATENDNKAYNLSFVEIGDEAVMLPSGKCTSKSNLLQLHRHAKRGPLNPRFVFVDPYSRESFTLSQELLAWLRA